MEYSFSRYLIIIVIREGTNFVTMYIKQYKNNYEFIYSKFVTDSFVLDKIKQMPITSALYRTNKFLKNLRANGF